MLRNMLEAGSSGHFKRFDEIIPLLKSLKGKLPGPNNTAKKRARFTVWHHLFVAILSSLAALLTFLYLNPELLKMVTLTIEHWGAAARNLF